MKNYYPFGDVYGYQVQMNEIIKTYKLIANKNIMKFQAKIGNNINQIARKCNESGVGPSNETMRLLINYIEESKAELLKGE